MALVTGWVPWFFSTWHLLELECLRWLHHLQVWCLFLTSWNYWLCLDISFSLSLSIHAGSPMASLVISGYSDFLHDSWCQSEWVFQETRWKQQGFLWPSLGSHPVYFPPYSISQKWVTESAHIPRYGGIGYTSWKNNWCIWKGGLPRWCQWWRTCLPTQDT